MSPGHLGAVGKLMPEWWRILHTGTLPLQTCLLPLQHLHRSSCTGHSNLQQSPPFTGCDCCPCLLSMPQTEHLNPPSPLTSPFQSGSPEAHAGNPFSCALFLHSKELHAGPGGALLPGPRAPCLGRGEAWGATNTPS